MALKPYEFLVWHWQSEVFPQPPHQGKRWLMPSTSGRLRGTNPPCCRSAAAATGACAPATRDPLLSAGTHGQQPRVCFSAAARGCRATEPEVCLFPQHKHARARRSDELLYLSSMRCREAAHINRHKARFGRKVANADLQIGPHWLSKCCPLKPPWRHKFGLVARRSVTPRSCCIWTTVVYSLWRNLPRAGSSPIYLARCSYAPGPAQCLRNSCGHRYQTRFHPRL